jgi:hypothetical protein
LRFHSGLARGEDVFGYALLEKVFGCFCLEERGRESCKNWKKGKEEEGRE